MLQTIRTKLNEIFPQFTFNINEVDDNSNYELIEIDFEDVDHTIIFRQIVGGGKWEDMENEEIADNTVEVVNRAIEGYKKLDIEEMTSKKYPIWSKDDPDRSFTKMSDIKTIKVLNQMEGVSFHKLTEEEFLERVERYELTDKDFKNKKD